MVEVDLVRRLATVAPVSSITFGWTPTRDLMAAAGTCVREAALVRCARDGCLETRVGNVGCEVRIDVLVGHRLPEDAVDDRPIAERALEVNVPRALARLPHLTSDRRADRREHDHGPRPCSPWTAAMMS